MGQGAAGPWPLLEQVHSQVSLGVEVEKELLQRRDIEEGKKMGTRFSCVIFSPALVCLWCKKSNGPAKWKVLSRVCGFQKRVGTWTHLDSDAGIFPGWGH